MRDSITKLSSLINRNTGYLIAVAVVVSAVSIINSEQDSHKILSDTSATIKNTERISGDTKEIAADTKTIITNLKDAVIDLKADSAQKALVLCKVILRNNITDITPEEEREIEAICKEEVEQDTQTGVMPQEQTQPQPQASTRESEDTLPPKDKDKPEKPEEPEKPRTALQQVIDRVKATAIPIIRQILERKG